MPGPGDGLFSQAYSFLTEPVWRGTHLSMILEAFQAPRPSSLPDESIGSFLSRRVSPHMANNIISAVLHGIYAGDVWQLSVKSIQPMLWWMEGHHGSITTALIEIWKTRSRFVQSSDLELIEELATKESMRSLRPVIKDASVYTFKRGLGQLGNQLQARLRKTKNVRVKTHAAISGIELDERSGGLNVSIFLHTPRFSR